MQYIIIRDIFYHWLLSFRMTMSLLARAVTPSNLSGQNGEPWTKPFSLSGVEKDEDRVEPAEVEDQHSRSNCGRNWVLVKGCRREGGGTIAKSRKGKRPNGKIDKLNWK